MALGDNVILSLASEMVEKVVVGRKKIYHMGFNTLMKWVNLSWFSILDHFPSVHVLSKGWFLLRFNNSVDVGNVLNIPWCIDLTSLPLKRRSPFFDSSCEIIDELMIWVRLPDLPIELWTTKGFECLGNSLGNYMETYMSFITLGIISMAYILVSLNIRKGFPEKIELTWGDRAFMQNMDYEGILFKCHGFRNHGHKAIE
jgi:hypothetical protein